MMEEGSFWSEIKCRRKRKLREIYCKRAMVNHEMEEAPTWEKNSCCFANSLAMDTDISSFIFSFIASIFCSKSFFNWYFLRENVKRLIHHIRIFWGMDRFHKQQNPFQQTLEKKTKPANQHIYKQTYPTDKEGLLALLQPPPTTPPLPSHRREPHS